MARFVLGSWVMDKHRLMRTGVQPSRVEFNGRSVLQRLKNGWTEYQLKIPQTTSMACCKKDHNCTLYAYLRHHQESANCGKPVETL